MYFEIWLNPDCFLSCIDISFGFSGHGEVVQIASLTSHEHFLFKSINAAAVQYRGKSGVCKMKF